MNTGTLIGGGLRAYMIALMVAACWLRVYELGRIPGLNGDEAWCAFQSAQLSQGRQPQWLTPSGPPLCPFFTAPQVALQWVLGYSIWTIRAPAALSGYLLILVAWRLVAKAFSETTALICVILMASLPVNLVYSRIGWYSSQSVLACLIAVCYSAQGRGTATWIALLGAVWVHVTNIFLAPALLASWLANRLARPTDSHRQTFQWLIANLTVAIVMLVAVVQCKPDLLHRDALSSSAAVPRRASVAELQSIAILVVRLFSGTTVYREVSGLGFIWTARMADGLTAVGLLAPLVWQVRRGRSVNATTLALAVGWLTALAGFILVAGAAGLEAHHERYGLFLIAPVVLWLSACVSDAAATPGRKRLALWVAATVGWLFLAGYWVGVVQAFQRPIPQSHRTYTTGPIEPKRRAVEIILGELPVRPMLVVTEDWWLFWPLRYLLSSQPRIEVMEYRGEGDLTTLTNRGGVVVAYTGASLDRAARIGKGGLPRTIVNVIDSRGQSFLSLVCFTPE